MSGRLDPTAGKRLFALMAGSTSWCWLSDATRHGGTIRVPSSAPKGPSRLESNSARNATRRSVGQASTGGPARRWPIASALRSATTRFQRMRSTHRVACLLMRTTAAGLASRGTTRLPTTRASRAKMTSLSSPATPRTLPQERSSTWRSAPGGVMGTTRRMEWRACSRIRTIDAEKTSARFLRCGQERAAPQSSTTRATSSSTHHARTTISIPSRPLSQETSHAILAWV
mmetsp:Transcript_59846/g.142264  ORF Transcript_59846/g.142264 Transcript_59846/m.142264 type:complete len:229 (+) Transcript_59846:4845-5531(+)